MERLQPKYRYRAVVIKVVDGDTVDCLIDLGFFVRTERRLRLARIDTPEINSKDPTERYYGGKSRDFIKALLLNKSVGMETTKTDIYGRYIAEVYIEVEGTVLNVSDEMLNKGYAKVYKG